MYLPIDDDHPLRAGRPYGMSKRLSEEMCEAWTSRTGIPTTVLRPVCVLDDDRLATTDPRQLEFGAFVHVVDVADAVVKALEVPAAGHIRMILCGPGEFDASRANRELGWQPSRGWPSRRKRLRAAWRRAG